jgi:DNA-binding transcriptional ArsR family regulator
MENPSHPIRDELILESADQIRALAHPLRQQILRLLTDEMRTNKQVAATLNEVPARVHFHIRELEAAGLIELVKEQPKGGVIEKYYRAVARLFRLGPSLDGSAALAESIPGAALDAARQALVQATAYFGASLPGLEVMHEQARLTKAAKERIQQHLNAIRDELQAAETTSRTTTEPNEERIVLTYLLHPLSPD